MLALYFADLSLKYKAKPVFVYDDAVDPDAVWVDITPIMTKPKPFIQALNMQTQREMMMEVGAVIAKSVGIVGFTTFMASVIGSLAEGAARVQTRNTNYAAPEDDAWNTFLNGGMVGGAVAAGGGFALSRFLQNRFQHVYDHDVKLLGPKAMRDILRDNLYSGSLSKHGSDFLIDQYMREKDGTSPGL